HDVADDQGRFAVERVAPAATTRSTDPDRLPRPDGLGVREGVDLALPRAARVDDLLERPSGPAAPDSPAREDRAVRDRHEVRVLEHPEVLLVAEAPAVLARSARVDGQRQLLDHEREAGLGELRGEVPGVR